jgi:hypothetical protein
MRKRKSRRKYIALFLSIAVMSFSVFVILSCSSGADIGEATKYLDHFEIMWPQGFTYLCTNAIPYRIKVNAIDQTGQVYTNWSGSNLAIEIQYGDVDVSPAFFDMAGGTEQIDLTFTLTGEENNTKIRIHHQDRSSSWRAEITVKESSSVMGRKIGDTPEDFTLYDYQSSSITLSEYRGKVILLAFLDVINGWEWLQKLCDVKSSLANILPQLQVLVVVYNHQDAGSETVNGIPFSGPISAIWIEQKLQDQGPACIDYPLIVNGSWSGSVAHSYDRGFSSLYDPAFHGNTGGAFFAYLISKDHRISDKWSKNCSSNGDPISFNKLGKKVALINPTGTFGTGTITIDLSSLPNLCGKRLLTYNGTPPSYIPDFSGPRIKSSIPADGSSISGSVTLLLSFTDSLSKTDVENPAHYSLYGAGATASIASGDVVYEEYPDFLSTDLDNTIFYLKQRILQLCCDPAILYADPEIHKAVDAVPAVHIVYSKPINHSGASYTVAGAGILSPSTSTPHTGTGSIENTSSLVLGGAY